MKSMFLVLLLGCLSIVSAYPSITSIHPVAQDCSVVGCRWVWYGSNMNEFTSAARCVAADGVQHPLSAQTSTYVACEFEDELANHVGETLTASLIDVNLGGVVCSHYMYVNNALPAITGYGMSTPAAYLSGCAASQSLYWRMTGTNLPNAFGDTNDIVRYDETRNYNSYSIVLWSKTPDHCGTPQYECDSASNTFHNLAVTGSSGATTKVPTTWTMGIGQTTGYVQYVNGAPACDSGWCSGGGTNYCILYFGKPVQDVNNCTLNEEEKAAYIKLQNIQTVREEIYYKITNSSGEFIIRTYDDMFIQEPDNLIQRRGNSLSIVPRCHHSPTKKCSSLITHADSYLYSMKHHRVSFQ